MFIFCTDEKTLNVSFTLFLFVFILGIYEKTSNVSFIFFAYLFVGSFFLPGKQVAIAKVLGELVA